MSLPHSEINKSPLAVPPSGLLTTEKAAKWLGHVSARSLERWRAQPQQAGPRCRMTGTRVYYHIDDLQAWVNSLKSRSLPSRGMQPNTQRLSNF